MTEEPITTPVARETFSSSPTLGKLADALAKAQGAILGAKKDASNPFFHSKYADLAAVWEACRAPLSANGLAVIQLPGRNGAGLYVDTILTHAEGEWISSRLYMTPVQDSPQGIGSAITYARRYGLQAIVGIAPEDDDGNAASGKTDDRHSDKAIDARQQNREEAARTARNAPIETEPRKGGSEAPVTNSTADHIATGPAPSLNVPPILWTGLTVINIEAVAGKTGKRVWTYFKVTFEREDKTQITANTFSEALNQQSLLIAQDPSNKVDVTVKPGKKPDTWELLSLAVVDEIPGIAS